MRSRKRNLPRVPSRPIEALHRRLQMAGTVIAPARSEAACQRGLVAPLVLDEWQRPGARERIL